MNALTDGLPPSGRSLAALGLLRGASAGLFMLQECSDCGTVQYPPRDACHRCLGSDLPWEMVENRGTLKAATVIRASNEPYFQERLPWRVGIVSSPLGMSMIAHLLPSCEVEQQVSLSLRFDAAGRAVVVASPLDDGTSSEAEPGLRPVESDFVDDPAGKVILVTDGSSDLGKEVTKALTERGAKQVIFDRSAGNADFVVDTTA
jgi:uncharacterized OB-fold protein